MDSDVSIYFRDQFRKARASSLRDAEGFQEIIFSIERLGFKLVNDRLSFNLAKKQTGLYKYKNDIECVAIKSPLAEEIPSSFRNWHLPFSVLYDLVRNARNDALHQGAYARHLTMHAIQLALVLEDALMTNATQASDFMVREPVCASQWQPISFVRQQMLANSFSYLPIAVKDKGTKWYLISDYNVARYLRSNPKQRDERLATTIGKAIESGKLKLEEVKCYDSDISIEDLQIPEGGKPVLIFAPKQKDHLLGILTAFDLL